MTSKNNGAVLEWLGIKKLQDWLKAPCLGYFFGFLLTLIGLALLVFCVVGFGLLVGAITGFGPYSGDPTGAAIRNIGLVLAAAFGAPFIAWRSMVAQKQADVAEQGQITDRINTAVEGLGAEKTVSIHRKDREGKYLYHEREGSEHRGEGSEYRGKNKLDYKRPVIVQLTEPNLEVRVGAVYALKRIAEDSPRDRVTILDILCSYVRQNAPGSEAIESPHQVFNELSGGWADTPPMNAHQIFRSARYAAANTIGVDPTELNQETLEQWSRTLPEPRIDVQTAITAIGSIKQEFYEIRAKYAPDLRQTNLQNIRLEGDFSNSSFRGAKLDNSIFIGTFVNTTMTECSLQNIRTVNCDFTHSDFLGSILSGAFFGASNCAKCSFRLATLTYTNFNGANLTLSDFFGADAEDVYCHANADASYSRFSRAKLSEFNGISEGPSIDLWVDAQTDIGNKMSKGRLVGSEQAFLGELDDRKLWIDFLRQRGLERPFS
ncbi:pentapeptide repeat-containing protein [Roseovarius atlanticus]|uniref:pentapeptide repeat-containing protein n=1 Tax=Roseovarius atlanticus TaxID=1641875 RepID=UPI001C945278|nr:pentapeptide repeat-containing protein [Roseovarius atlanticus]MBY5988354.1 pentapeptide repeat-containing protein [Roseovarius atlanticus]MBY6123745.1 pentapeptide repeat-containing protein [Roseovarius atlanticus]MBY6148240.1 pentapeptide repeat-containing protein [Roseovarius atlanticus]